MSKPNHLSLVNSKHIPFLWGFRLKFSTKGNGAAMTNAVAVMIYEDETKGTKVKRMVNDHIAEYFDSYFIKKSCIPS